MNKENNRSSSSIQAANISVCHGVAEPAKGKWVLMALIKGSAVHKINEITCLFNQADACLLRPADVCCTVSSSEDCQHLSFLVDADFVNRYSSLAELTLYSDLLNSDRPLQFHLTDELLADMEKEVSLSQSVDQTKYESIRNYRLLFQKLFICFLEQYSYGPQKHPLWLLQFVERLQDVGTFAVPLSQLAHFTPYSYSRLTRIFKTHMGISLIDYVTDIKLEHAKYLLKHTDYTMLAISSKLDFSVSYFNKLFKRKTGLTPGQYRNKHREE